MCLFFATATEIRKRKLLQVGGNTRERKIIYEYKKKDAKKIEC